MQIEVGLIVVNPKQQNLGPGKVLAVDGAKARVHFRDDHEQDVRTLSLKHVGLVPAPEPDSAYFDHLPPFDGRNFNVPERRVTFDEGVERFLRRFPHGFTDQSYLDGPDGERNYKLAATELYSELLGDGRGRKLLERGAIAEAGDALLAVNSRVNLLSPYESMALGDALKENRTAAGRFCTALFRMIDSASADRGHFESLAQAVGELPAEEGRARVETWPVLTLFPFIARPDAFMFLKPLVTRNAAARLRWDLRYTPQLRWATYSSLLSMSGWLLERLKPFGARDYIDVQSFIWVVESM